jgi:hypothetical protein
MQQEIKLTNESSNTVFVDDVDVRKGVYYINNAESLTLFIIYDGERYELIDTKGNPKTDKGNTLIELLSSNDWRSGNFYTIPDNKRIITEREVTIDDLKDTDYVGIEVSTSSKVYIVYVGDGRFMPISSNGNITVCNSVFNSDITYHTIQGCLTAVNATAVYRFTTRKELYKWLAE